MTQTKQKRLNERGNAMIYVLIALALFGFLTVTLSRQNDQSDSQDISDEQAALYANELMQYASAAEQVIDQMRATGTDVDELDFVLPSEAAFNTGSHIHKVFHPQGGGLNYQREINEAYGINGSDSFWYFQQTTNIEWTPTTANDAVISALRFERKVCEAINERITGSTDIPALTADLFNFFNDNGAAQLGDFEESDCPSCGNYPTLCVSNTAGTSFGFYSIIAAQ